MTNIHRTIIAALAALFVGSGAAAQTCLTSNTAFQNASYAAQSAPFELTFDAKPNAARMDGVIGFSGAQATSFTGMAAIVRFNNLGNIDVRNGGAYAATQTVPYTAGAVYRFQMRVDPVAKRYSVYVAPPGGSFRTIASNYAFRTEQAGTSTFRYWSLTATSGTHQVCNVALKGASGDSTPPSVSITAPSAGATVSNTVTVSAGASDNVGVAGVQFRLNGVNLGAEDTSAPFAVSWDTTKATNASHSLTAVARDAAGNRTTSAPVSVTVRNATSGGAASVRHIYPTASGGKVWYSKWDNGVARTFTSGQTDPSDAWFRGRGNATYKVDGSGLFKISGATPRMYVHDPSLSSSWRNVEMTVYAMRVRDSGTAYAGIVGVARTNHGSTGVSESTARCDSRGVGSRFRYDGHLDLEKETSHPYSRPTNNKTFWPGGLPYNRWIGWKMIVYDLPNGNVKVESWMDDGETGRWVKVNEIEDNGSNFGLGGTACKSGINPALRLTNSDARPGTESGKPNVAVYFRSDNVGTDGLIYKKMSVREISVQ